MKENLVIWGLYALACVIWIAGFVSFGNLAGCGEGIYPSPTGQSVYIKGESCVINATPDIDEQDFLDEMLFCSIQHQSYLTEVKNLQP